MMKDKMQKIKKLNGRGIRSILNSAYKILGNPIVLFDTSYNLLAFTEGIVTDDRLWNELVTLGTFSHETVDFFKLEDFILSFAKSETVALMKSNKLKYDRMNGKLFDKDDVQLGDICVVACGKPFEENDATLIEALCEVLSDELQNSEYYQKIERVYQESLLDDLIDGNVKDNEYAKVGTEELYGELKPNLFLAVVDVTQYETTNTHLAYFRDLFRKLQPEYKYYIHLNNIIIIISTDYAILSVGRDLEKLIQFFEKYNIYAGISSKFHDLHELKECYRQALNALNYGLESRRKNQQIFSYDNFRVEHFIQTAAANPSDVCSPIVRSIQEYDRQNKTSMLNLLYAYLQYGMDLSLTSEALSVKPEELSDRLKKMEEFFMIDWKDGNMLLNLFISIKMLDSVYTSDVI